MELGVGADKKKVKALYQHNTSSLLIHINLDDMLMWSYNSFLELSQM